MEKADIDRTGWFADSYLPMPAPTGVAAQFFGALFASHYLSVILVVQLIPAALLLIDRYVPWRSPCSLP
jgi:hypothetical protein